MGSYIVGDLPAWYFIKNSSASSSSDPATVLRSIANEAALAEVDKNPGDAIPAGSSAFVDSKLWYNPTTAAITVPVSTTDAAMTAAGLEATKPTNNATGVRLGHGSTLPGTIPNRADGSAAQNGDFFHLDTIDGANVVGVYVVNNGALVFDEPVSSGAHTGKTRVISRLNATTGMEPTGVEFASPVDGSFAIVFLNDGKKEYWSHDGAGWGLTKTEMSINPSEITGYAATYAGLPTTVDGNYSLLTVDDIGTGTALAPQYPKGVYKRTAGAWVLVSADNMPADATARLLPLATVADNDKILQVVAGQWAKAQPIQVAPAKINVSNTTPDAADTTHKVWINTSVANWPTYYRDDPAMDAWPSVPIGNTFGQSANANYPVADVAALKAIVAPQDGEIHRIGIGDGTLADIHLPRYEFIKAAIAGDEAADDGTGFWNSIGTISARVSQPIGDVDVAVSVNGLPLFGLVYYPPHSASRNFKNSSGIMGVATDGAAMNIVAQNASQVVPAGATAVLTLGAGNTPMLFITTSNSGISLSFQAYHQASPPADVYISGTYHPTHFEFDNSGGAMDLATGLFTAPVAGLYQFGWYGYRNNDSGRAAIYKNGTIYAQVTGVQNGLTASVQLAQGDTVNAGSVSGNTFKLNYYAGKSHNWFFGMRLGA